MAFIWGITANLDKVGIQNSSIIFWIISFNIFILFIMIPIVFFTSKRAVRQLSANYKSLGAIGMFGAFTALSQLTALSMALVAYVISIKRTSALMSVMFGYIIFKEKGVITIC